MDQDQDQDRPKKDSEDGQKKKTQQHTLEKIKMTRSKLWIRTCEGRAFQRREER